MNRLKRLATSLIGVGLPLVALLLAGCADGRRYDQAICVLIDVSGTYADQRMEVVRTIKREVLPNMMPGDTLLVLRIDAQSYDRENVEALLTLDARPSRANAQKLALAQTLDQFAKEPLSAKHTDIPGAMMLGSEYLRELASGSRVMLIFSDMKEDLAPGTKREIRADEFEEIAVIALNVKRLGHDNANPEIFRTRMDDWEKRVRGAGGHSWQAIMDSRKLPETLSNLREGESPSTPVS